MGSGQKEILWRELKTGDVVFTGSEGVVSRFVRWVTGGRVNKENRNIPTHVGIVVSIYTQSFVLEMWVNGLRMVPLSHYNRGLRKDPYIVDIKRAKDLGDSSRKALLKLLFVDFRNGLEYDWAGDLAFLFKSAKQDKSKYFCSEYVIFRLQSVLGITYFGNDTDASKWSPLDVMLSSQLASIIWEKPQRKNQQ